jgi:hypothetical protein
MFEKLHIYFKTRVGGETIVWIFFMVYGIIIDQLNLGPFRN